MEGLSQYLNTHTNTQMYMGTKNIAIMDDVYETLLSLKKKDESFSDELRRLLKSKEALMSLAGAWKHIPDSEIKSIKKTLAEMKKGTRVDEVIERMNK